MRRLLAVIVMVALMATMVWAGPPSSAISSGVKTSSTGVVTSPGLLTGVLILTDGSNSATVTVYDSDAANGQILFKATVAGASYFGGATFEIPIQFNRGVYVSLSGTGASYVVYYSLGG